MKQVAVQFLHEATHTGNIRGFRFGLDCDSECEGQEGPAPLQHTRRMADSSLFFFYCGREDINSGSKDAHELYARDRLRRNVQWMAGVSALEPPTLSEMGKLNDALFEKVGGAGSFPPGLRFTHVMYV